MNWDYGKKQGLSLVNRRPKRTVANFHRNYACPIPFSALVNPTRQHLKESAAKEICQDHKELLEQYEKTKSRPAQLDPYVKYSPSILARLNYEAYQGCARLHANIVGIPTEAAEYTDPVTGKQDLPCFEEVIAPKAGEGPQNRQGNLGGNGQDP